MRTIYTLILISIINIVNTQAGVTAGNQASLPNFSNTSQFPRSSIKNAAQRTGSELVKAETGYRHDKWDTTGGGGTWVGSDSAKYLNNTLKLDTVADSVVYNGLTWASNSRGLYAYDAAGNDTSQTDQLWDTLTGTWVNYDNFSFTYNGNGNQLTRIYRLWDTTQLQWVNQYKHSNYYNATADDTNSTYFSWDNTNMVWVNNYRDTYTYDNNHNVLLHVSQNWDTANKVWDNVIEYMNSYNSAGKVDSNISQNWIGNVWMNGFLYTSIYNAKGLDSVDIYETWGGSDSTWQNLYAENYTYDNAGNKLTDIYSSWDTLLNKFDLYIDKYTNSYNSANLMITQLYQTWDSGAIINNTADTITYDVNGNQTGNIYYFWNTGSNKWVANYLSASRYDANNNNVYTLYQSYDIATSRFLNTDQYYYYFQQTDTTAGIKEVKNQLNVNLFPNPTDGIVNIELMLNDPSPIALNVYDLNGRLVMTENRNMNNGTNHFTIGATDLAKGFYTVQLMNLNTHESSVLKLVKE